MAHTAKKYLEGKTLSGISAKTVEIHRDKLYAGYVNKRNEIEEKLKTADKSSAHQTQSDWRGLKEGETFAVNGMILHEYYFGILGGDGDVTTGPTIKGQIEKDFGSMENWQAEMTASGLAARGWAVTAFDPSDQKLHVFIGDTQNQGAVWGTTPVVALDVFEHSYFIDVGSDRKTYIETFFKNIDWAKVEAIWTKIAKTYPAPPN